MTIRTAALVAAFSLPLLAPVQARAQIDSREGIALQNQILELQNQVQQMQAQGGGGGGGRGQYVAPPAPRGRETAGQADLLAQLLDRVSQLEDQVRSLRGRVDELNNQVARQQADFAKQLGDLSFKMQNGGGGAAAGGSAPPATPPAAPSAPAAPSSAAPRTPEIALQSGNAALARRDYPAAEQAAREVLANPRSPRATEANFLLAQALAGERNYQAAAVAYDDTYNRAKTGPRAQDSLYGLANMLIAINAKKAACETLDKMRTEFGAPRGEARDQIAATRQRADCH